jgi:hypothetical protein
MMPAHAGDRDALRRIWKPARADSDRLSLRYILKMQMGALLGENAHRLRTITDCGCARVAPAPSDSPDGASTLSNRGIVLNAKFYVSSLAANTEKT